MPADSDAWSRRDSWPPTQVRLKPALSKSEQLLDDMQDMENNPLTYFLTPASDDGIDDMDFDTGIQDSSPRETVRSVSPSSLEGPRARTPELDWDDDEGYMRLSPTSRQPLGSDHGLRSPVFPRAGLLSPSYPAARGRPGSTRARWFAQAPRLAQALRLAQAALRPGRLWREPSPDVWSIEEETEEELRAVGKAAKPEKRVRFVLPAKIAGAGA